MLHVSSMLQQTWFKQTQCLLSRIPDNCLTHGCLHMPGFQGILLINDLERSCPSKAPPLLSPPPNPQTHTCPLV